MTEVLPNPTKGPWIGVDLDGTLAHYDKYVSPGHIGPMIPKMKEIIIQWLKNGYRVKIMTARMSHEETADQSKEAIQDWLEENGLPRLDVTCIKDYKMIRLYDDRAIQVLPNSGTTLEEIVKDLLAENAALKDQLDEVEFRIMTLDK